MLQTHRGMAALVFILRYKLMTHAGSSSAMEMLTPPVLKGERVHLGPLKMDNLHTHFKWNNDPELNRYDSLGPVNEREPLSSFMKRFERMVVTPPPGVLDWEIITPEGELIGVAFADHLSMSHERCRIGVTICKRDYWGEGYGCGTLHVLLRYLFDDLELHRVSAEAFAFNSAWRSLLEGMGFSHEMSQRDFLVRDGERHNLHTYAMLRPYYVQHAEALPRPWEKYIGAAA